MKVKISDEKMDLESIGRLFKPSLNSSILATLVLFSPYGMLLMHISSNDYTSLMTYAILSGIALPLISLVWVLHVKNIKSYKDKAKRMYEKIKYHRNDNN